MSCKFSLAKPRKCEDITEVNVVSLGDTREMSVSDEQLDKPMVTVTDNCRGHVTVQNVPITEAET